jgi:hypothetical protein
MGGRIRKDAVRSARLARVEYAGGLEAIVFTLASGRVGGVRTQVLDGLDPSPITRVTLFDGGESLLVEQFSGNSLELSAQAVVDRAEEGASARPVGGGRLIASVRTGRYCDPL